MSLQNRVDPFGRLIETPARGGWIGNRGVLHDAAQKILRPYRLKAWLICVLEFKGRWRPVMAPNRWTELFFLDEATALAAGHRPCMECRRESHLRFRLTAGQGAGRVFQKAGDMDEALHADRLTAEGGKRTYKAKLGDLPDGAFVARGDQAWLKWDGQLHQWTPAGYVASVPVEPAEEAEVLTPRLTVEAIRAGYIPQVAL